VRLQVVVVGAPRGPLAAAIAEYEQRAARYWPLVVREVKEGRGAPAVVVREEGERLRAACGTARLVCCTERGEALTSAQFATRVAGWQEAARDVALVIGGAFGLEASLVAAAEREVALAPFTVPHEMARLLLAEQLYRAGTIRRGEPYHK
jgi:23S rRNA (pseudouridine1915-N3)-methyltransferase